MNFNSNYKYKDIDINQFINLYLLYSIEIKGFKVID